MNAQLAFDAAARERNDEEQGVAFCRNIAWLVIGKASVLGRDACYLPTAIEEELRGAVQSPVHMGKPEMVLSKLAHVCLGLSTAVFACRRSLVRRCNAVSTTQPARRPGASKEVFALPLLQHDCERVVCRSTTLRF